MTVVSLITYLISSGLTIVSCSLVILSILSDQQSSKSYFLQLITRLLFSNMGVAICIMVFAVVDTTSVSFQKVFCRYLIPVEYFFVMSSYGWSIVLAFKFRREYSNNQHTSSKMRKPPVPFYVIWILSGKLCITLFKKSKLISIQSTCLLIGRIRYGTIVRLITWYKRNDFNRAEWCQRMVYL